MSLTSCLKKAGTAINQADRAAILARSRALRGEGMSAKAAAVQAVDELIAKLQGQVDGHPARVAREGGDQYVAQGTRRRYTENHDQLQLFIDSEPDPSQQGPAVEAARRDAVAAVDDLHATGTVLGQALSRDYAARQRVSLVGQKVTSNEDLAVLAQVYRDPRFETLRVIFTDADNKVVSQIGLTSRLPAAAVAIVGNDIHGYLAGISAAAKQRNATSFYMLHNHPSGQSKASAADERLTEGFATLMPDLDFAGHVIIDTNEYTTINRHGESTTHKKDFGQPGVFSADQWSGFKIGGPSDLMQMAKQLQVDDDAVTLVTLTHQLEVKSITTIPASSIKANERTRNALMIAKVTMRQKGSRVAAVSRNGSALTRLGHVVVDAIHVQPDGTVKSLASLGVVRGDQTVFPSERRPRLSPDTSADFHYLRPLTQQQQQSGFRAAESTAANVFGGAPAIPGAPTAATAQPHAPAMPWAVPEPGRLDNIIRYIQNNRIDIKRTVDAVKEAGRTVADDANPYLQDELYIGKVRAQLDRLADEQVTPLLRAISNSGFTPEQVNEYLWARHAEERNRQMALVNDVPFTPALDLAGMSTTDARAKLAAFQAMPQFARMQRIAGMVDQITHEARTKIVVDGLEDASVIQAWEGAYKHYVPLQRDVEEAGGKAGGYNVKGSESRRAVGSSKEAVNILANVIAQAEATIIRAEKAAVGRSVLDMARQHPNPDFWSVDTPPTERAIDPRTGLVTTRVVPNYKALDNVFTVKEAGVEHFVVFNEKNPRAVQFARTLKNLDAAEIGPVIETMGKATRYLAQWVTSRNPFFWMTNFARDVQGVAFNLQSTPLAGQAPQVMANIPAALGGFARLNSGKKTGRWTQLAQEFKDAGGQTGYMDQYRDSVERMGEIVKEVERMGQSAVDPRRIGRGILAVLEGANDTIENGVRLAVYAQAREEGISQAQAASIAKNISVNFNRKGNATGLYNALYMFFNANIQGNVRMIQGVQQSRRAQAYAGILTMAGAAVALLNLAGAGEDEETRKKRYELVPEWERERNWIVFLPGSDAYIKIPLPLGPHVLFNAGRILAEIGLEDGADPIEKAGSFVSSMISAFNPVGGGLPTPDATGAAQLATPTIARPVVDVVLNQNFAGIPITRENNFPGYKKPNYMNGRENTPAYWTTAAKALNDWTGGDNIRPGKVNLSPEQLAYLVKGYAVPGIAQTIDKVAGQAMSHKDTPVDQIVGVSKFFGRIDDNERRRAAYEVLREDEQRLGEYKGYIKAGQRDKAREVLTRWGGGSEDNGRRLLGQYMATDKVLTSYRRQKRDVGGDVDRADAINSQIDRRLAVYLANTRDMRKKVVASSGQ